MNDNQIKDTLKKEVTKLDQITSNDNKNVIKACKALAQLNITLLNNLESKDKFINHLLDTIKEKNAKISNYVETIIHYQKKDN